MVKPVILTLDDDPVVLRTVTRDLRSRYGEDYRIVRADAGSTALDALRELKQRSEPVALFLVDQRMPEMNGVEFLAEAMKIYPDAKRALLTAYADTEAAIHAINTAAIHHYLLKPWDPPEEKLYPVLDDLLEDWLGNYRPPFEGIRIIGHRWSSDTHQLKDFLARNHIPYQYFDIELESGAQAILDQFGLDRGALPVAIMTDGEVVQHPVPSVVAEKVGLKTQATQPFYDLVIVGGGPAGLAAAVYGASEGLRTVMIEREAPGGQAGTSSRIENYLGFPSGLSGADLARRASAQAKRFGVEILAPQEAVNLRLEGQSRIITLADGSEISCHALVIAAGLTYRKLDIPGLDALTGAGIYYGASVTEVTSCRNQPAYIVGAGNSAGQAAIYLSGYASKVVLVVRGSSLAAKMSSYLVERIETMPNIEVILDSEISAVGGVDHLESITIRNCKTDAQQTLPASGLFVFIGAIPCTKWLEGVIKLDEHGFVMTGPRLMENGKRPQGWLPDRDPFLLETSVPGIFAVGDVRSNSVKRVASAVGEGSIAVQFVHQFLSEGR